MAEVIVIRTSVPVIRMGGPSLVVSALKQGLPGAPGATGAPGQAAIAAKVSLAVPAGVESLAITSPLAPGVAQGISITVQQPSDGELLLVGGWSGSLDGPTVHFAGSISTAGTHVLQVTFFN